MTDGGFVRFRLDDGRAVVVSLSDMRLMYDALWELAPEQGAVSTAALLLQESRQPVYRTINLTAVQSAIMRKAVAQIEAHD